MGKKTVPTADEMQAKKAVPKKGAPKKTPKKKPALPTKIDREIQARMEQMPEMARGQESPPEGTAQTGAVTGGASPLTPAMLSELMRNRPLPTQPGPGQVVSPEQQSYEEAMMEKRLAAQQRNRREARQNLKDEQMRFAEEEAVQKAVQDRESNAARQQRLNYAQQVANEPSK